MTEYWQNVYLIYHGGFLPNEMYYGHKYPTRCDAARHTARLTGILVYRLHVKLKAGVS